MLSSRVLHVQQSLSLSGHYAVGLNDRERNGPLIDLAELESKLPEMPPISSFKSPYTDTLETLYAEYLEMKEQAQTQQYLHNFAELSMKIKIVEAI